MVNAILPKYHFRKYTTINRLGDDSDENPGSTSSVDFQSGNKQEHQQDEKSSESNNDR